LKICGDSSFEELEEEVRNSLQIGQRKAPGILVLKAFE